MRNSMLSQILEQGARARCELMVMLTLLIRVLIFFLRDGNESFNLIGSCCIPDFPFCDRGGNACDVCEQKCNNSLPLLSIVKNCDFRLENATCSLRQHFQDPGHSFPHTDLPSNSIYFVKRKTQCRNGS